MEAKQMEFSEKFYGKLYKVGDSIVVTIPATLVKGAGLTEGDQVVVMLKKHTTQ
jgi:antitoxin component of MazEF toxin-antitoxin module